MKISLINSRKILDSRGEWTLEVEIRLSNGATGKTSVPQGKSKGSLEAKYVAPEQAIENIENIIGPALINKKIETQDDLDGKLLELDQSEDKSNLGGNAILGVSFAFAKAEAFAAGIPLWKYIRKLLKIESSPVPPKLMMNMINGGEHAENNLEIQEYLLIPKVKTVQEAIGLSVNFYQILKNYIINNVGRDEARTGDEGGFAPNLKDLYEPLKIFDTITEKMHLEGRVSYALDAAGNSLKIAKPQLFEIYKEISEKYPLYSIEDPFGEKDFEDFAKLKQDLNNQVVIIGDDLTVTNTKLLKKAKEKDSVSGVIIKPNQIGTLTESLEAIEYAKQQGWKIVVSHRSGETDDDFISDLAWGADADGFKLGAPARGERIAKYNRLLEIEGSL